MSRLRFGLRLCVALVLAQLVALGSAIAQQNAASEAQAEARAPEASYSPIADPKAVVIERHARFTVLTPQLIRMEWAADGKFEDHASLVFINRRLPVPAFTSMVIKSGTNELLEIKTSDLELSYTSSVSDDGRFTPDNLTIKLQVDGKPVTWHPGLEDTGNLKGTTRTLDEALGEKTKEPIEPGLLSRDGWTLVDDSKRPLFDSDNFAFGQGEKSPWPWVMERPAGDRQDWYFFGYGHEYKQALHDYVTVAGRIPLPPRFAFGAWWSRYWAYSDQELNELVRGFHQNTVPLDVLVIDMDWHLSKEQLQAMQQSDQSGHDLGWSGYTWNPLLFPDPDAFLKNLHDQGLKATLNLHPASGVQPWEGAYPAMAKAMGTDPSTRKFVPFDITNKKFATNYMDLLHHPLEKQGIDFWWLDWQQEANTQMAGVSPTWWLNYVHFTDQEREGKRPLLFHRWGGLGNHRYQIGFSGDTISVWDSLAFQPWFTATAANVGYAYWSHDIGGHMPGAVDGELYARWIQFGIFSPILRTHTTKNPDAERRIWAYPEPFSDVMRNAFQERYAMQPYIYTEARLTYDTGVGFLHPLYYDWPEEDAAYTSKGEYVFGEEMVVAPVTKAREKETLLSKESVWIPKGEWIERASGKHFTGPQTVERTFSIEQIPVYVKAGAIIPGQPQMRYTGEKPVDPLIVTVYPLADGQESSYKVYEDASDSEAYKRGICAWTKIEAKQSGDELTIDVDPVQGSFPGMLEQRGFEMRLPADWPPQKVTANGAALALVRKDGVPGWRVEGNTLTTVITVPRTSVHSKTHIVISRAAGSLASRAQLDGFAGAIARLRAAYDSINAILTFAKPPNTLIDAMQTGDRIHYRPETARMEMARFSGVYAKAMTDVQALVDQTTVPEEQLEAKVAKETNQPMSVPERAQRYKLYLGRAKALLGDGAPK